MEALKAQKGAGGKWEGNPGFQEGLVPWVKCPWAVVKHESESEGGQARPPHRWKHIVICRDCLAMVLRNLTQPSPPQAAGHLVLGSLGKWYRM